jgi:predicted negative regulator of RcsB-dependent stress response
LPLPSQHTTSRLENPGDEILVPLTRAWERHGRIVLGVVAGLVIVGAIGYFSLRSRQAAEEAAAGRLAEATVLYWQGEYQQSLERARAVAQQYGSTPSGIDAHRQAGDAAFWGGDFKTAIAEYRQYLGHQKDGLLADAARRSLAYALESDRQFTEAIKEYEALVGHLDRASSAEFLYAAARCYLQAGQPKPAIERLQRLTDEYGETTYANQARIQLAELQVASPGSVQP